MILLSKETIYRIRRSNLVIETIFPFQDQNLKRNRTPRVIKEIWQIFQSLRRNQRTRKCLSWRKLWEGNRERYTISKSISKSWKIKRKWENKIIKLRSRLVEFPIKSQKVYLKLQKIMKKRDSTVNLKKSKLV